MWTFGFNWNALFCGCCGDYEIFCKSNNPEKRITVNISLKGQVTPSDVQCFPYCKQRDTF